MKTSRYWLRQQASFDSQLSANKMPLFELEARGNGKGGYEIGKMIVCWIELPSLSIGPIN